MRRVAVPVSGPRIVVLAVVLGLVASSVPASARPGTSPESTQPTAAPEAQDVGAAEEEEPIVGTWEFEGGAVYVAPSGGGFTGTVVKPTKFSTCVHPKGQKMWEMTGADGSYEGTHVGFFTSDCSEYPGWPSTWDVDEEEGELLWCWESPDGFPTGCDVLTRKVDKYPIILVPGFLGSIVKCGSDVLWLDSFGPEFKHMRLAKDGVKNYQKGSDCNKKAKAGKIIKSVGPGWPATVNVYKGAVKFLKKLKRKAFFFSYDWRKSASRHMKKLDRLVNKARVKSGYDKVVLMAHSMGGLVSSRYVQTLGANKVARIVTLGTPFWGAPSPWLALSHGWTSAHSNALDAIIPNRDLRKAAKNMTGAYYLYPNRKFTRKTKGWLKLPDMTSGWLDAGDVKDAVDVANGNSDLLRHAYGEHATFFHRLPAGVEIQMVVGTGLDTVVKVKERRNFRKNNPKYVWGNGDGTVPMLSGSSGYSRKGKNKLVTYVCGVSHVDLPNDAGVHKLIKKYLLKGKDIPRKRKCKP